MDLLLIENKNYNGIVMEECRSMTKLIAFQSITIDFNGYCQLELGSLKDYGMGSRV